MYFAILVITEFKYQSKMYRFAFTQWRNAQQLGKVSNWPNTRQSKIFTQFPLEGSFKLLENMKCLLTNVKRFQTLHWFFSGQTLRACAYHIIARLSSDIVVCTSSENLFTKKPTNFFNPLTFLNKHQILLRSLKEPFGRSYVKFFLLPGMSSI